MNSSQASSQASAEELWSRVCPDDAGLVPCVAQDVTSKAVLMVAWVSEDALARSLETGFATFYSRSRQTLWTKGETSGHKQRIVHIRLDCDGDTLLYAVDAQGPACHEGTDTCFSWRQSGMAWIRDPVPVPRGETEGQDVLTALETVIAARAAGTSATSKPSYTKTLLDAGPEKQVAKIREEADEFAQAITQEANNRVASEGADVIYHMAVALRGRGMSFTDVFAELSRRFGTSGIEEKASRSKAT